MIWLVQSNLFREAGYSRFMEALDRTGAEYRTVEARHFIDKLFYAEPPYNEGAELVPCTEPVFAMGSYKLARLARDVYGMRPGAYLEGLAYTDWQWPKEHLLNGDAWIGRLGDLPFPPPGQEHLFVRPVGDSKLFAGSVVDAAHLHLWRDDIVLQGNYVTRDTQVVVAEAKSIYLEVRCWIVDGQLVTWSTYKRGGRPYFSWAHASMELLDFAQRMATLWSPNPAYVLDVASTPAGPRIVEVNSISSAGFYEGDVQRLVHAISEHVHARKREEIPC